MEDEPLDFEIELEKCPACGGEMEITMLPIYTNVQCPHCGEHTHVKSRIGGYQIFKRQGVGGMSVVYGATDVSLGRNVAIKLLNEEYSQDKKRAAEFEKEAQITASISHPNVVRVYTVGQEFNRYYIAMELVEGESLEEMIARSGPQDEEMIAKLAIEIADGLYAAHSENLLHRDMKPGNVLIDRDGHAKIVDFGLALMTSGGTAIADEVWATPYYVPPETLEMKPEDLRSDVFALGASLYHALSGKPPFTTETRSTTELLKIKQEVAPLEEVAPNVSQALCDVINKAMAYEVGDRYQDYAELKQALRKVDEYYQSGRDPKVLEDPVSLEEVSRARSASRQKATGSLIAVFCLIVVAGILVVMDRGAEPVVAPVLSEVAEVPEPEEETEEELEAKAQEAVRLMVASMIRDAQTLMEAKKFSDAQKVYLALAMEPNVEGETVYWAGVHSAMASWMKGDSNRARRSLHQVLKRRQEQESEPNELEQRLRAALSELQGFDSVMLREEGEVGEDLHHIILFASALKEWEQGNWKFAVSKFRRVMSAFSSSHGTAGAYYESVSRDYLADYQVLRNYAGAQPEINDRRDADAALAKLGKLAKALKTQGRAPYNVMLWKQQVGIRLLEAQTRREEHQERIKQEEIAAERSWQKRQDDIRASIEEHRLTQLADELEAAKPRTDEGKEWIKQLSYLSGLVQNLFKITEKELDGELFNFALKGSEGIHYTLILGSTPDGFLVSDQSGVESLLKWDMVDPSDFIDLHRQLISSELSESARREGLVAYAYLTGLEEFAELGAMKLAEDDEDFAQRWMACMSIIESYGVDSNDESDSSE
ncbi:serine/threonine-protein kinase [Rubritalea marina]|uniref:serine/threonine-protein kinase n=1 Tax=Rubritalea marina TaxID=361055 RepID=UPI000361B0B1|nr:serine/threonine-protein kinase [Rubritalea marina]